MILHQQTLQGPSQLNRIKQSLEVGDLLILSSGKLISRNRDNTYPFRADSNFIYATGLNFPDLFLVVKKHTQNETQTTLFCPKYSEERLRWDSGLFGLEVAEQMQAELGFDEVLKLSELAAHLKQHLPKPYHLENGRLIAQRRQGRMDATLQPFIIEALGEAHHASKMIFLPATWLDAEQFLAHLRTFKQDDEIACMQKALAITQKAHHHLISQVTTFTNEAQLEGAFLSTCLSLGAQELAYPSIIASGVNACVLHYRQNNSELKKGDMVLVDAGCEFQGYASDITRTFPLSGRFSAPQKALYQAVLEVQAFMIEAISPQQSLASLQSIARLELSQKLLDLGFFKGETKAQSVVEQDLDKVFYPHSIGHHLGLDVHDDCLYLDHHQKPLTFKQGMVFTIEPGLYIPPHTPHCSQDFWEMGVRIEDNIALLARPSYQGGDEGGYEVVVLSDGIEKTIDGIEALAQG